MPGVRAAVVFGRESILRNEEVAACVVAEERVRESDLLEHCRARLSGWQVPKRIFFVEEIPVNERGKVNRRELAGTICFLSAAEVSARMIARHAHEALPFRTRGNQRNHMRTLLLSTIGAVLILAALQQLHHDG